MTAERIKEIYAATPEDFQIVLSEMQTIYEAAEKDPFWMISYAYTYGFHRGAQSAKEGAE